MTERRKVKNIIKIWTIILSLFVLIGYGSFQAMDFVKGPIIEIQSPFNGSVSDQSLVEIEGFATNLSFLSLNGNKIFTDESGLFKEKILLSKGYNLFTIKAEDRFGRIEEKTLQLIYK